MPYLFATYCIVGSALAMTPSLSPPETPARSTPTVVAPRPAPRRSTASEPGYAGKPKPAPKKATPAKKGGKKAEKKAASAADAAVEKVQRFYEQTDDLSAEFVQTYARVALSRSYESRGKVTIKKPGMMRWDYSAPEPKHFIADGKQLWIYEPEEEQAILDPSFEASELTTSVSFLWGQGKLSDAFTAALGDAKSAPPGSIVLELTPRKDATYTRMTLVVDAETGMVKASTLHETSGNTNRFEFRDVKTNTGVAATAFQFTPPPGIDVVRRP